MSKDSIKFGDKDYALVPARLKKFRETNPRASIKSEAKRFEDGSLEFVTVIVQDKSDEYSADADGHATYSADELKKAKAFEKLETISVGRALAKLGYLNDGQIATSEEMEEFEQYKEDKQETAKAAAIELLGNQTSLADLKTVFIGLGELMADKDVISAKDAAKERLNADT